MSGPRRKIPHSQSQDPLQSPFAGLSSDGLPPGRETPAAVATGRSAPKRPRVILRREKARRGGKTVIVISQLPSHLSPPEIESLMRGARKSLGCGGSLEGREIELQGDQPDRVRTFLETQGFAVGGV